MGDRKEALAAVREAVQLRRHLAKDRPAAFNSALARSLHNLSRILSSCDCRKDALDAAREAVEMYEPLARERPRVFNGDLADSLIRFADCLDAVNRDDEAGKVRKELEALRERDGEYR